MIDITGAKLMLKPSIRSTSPVIRPSARAELTDSVIVLKDRFANFDVRAYRSTPK